MKEVGCLYVSVSICLWHNVFLQPHPQCTKCTTVSVITDMLSIKSSQTDIAGFTSYEVDFILESLGVCVDFLYIT